QVGADLVAHVAAPRRAVGADDAEVDLAVLHQVAAGVVGNHGVRHAVLAELPGGQAGPLIAGPRFVNPDMDRDAGIVRLVDRRQCRAPVDGGEPAGVAVGEGVDALAARLEAADLAEAMLADAPADLDILVADFGRALVG